MVSFKKSYSFNDESYDDESDSGSAGKCAFIFRFDDSVGHVGESVGRVSGVGSGFFVPTGIESIGDIVPLFVLLLKGVESKGGPLIKIFWRPKS